PGTDATEPRPVLRNPHIHPDARTVASISDEAHGDAAVAHVRTFLAPAGDTVVDVGPEDEGKAVGRGTRARTDLQLEAGGEAVDVFIVPGAIDVQRVNDH